MNKLTRLITFKVLAASIPFSVAEDLSNNNAQSKSDQIQAELRSIAEEEARIANIGANKYMMLYGKSNPIPIINRWNTTTERPALTNDQINEIQKLESKKQQILSSGVI